MRKQWLRNKNYFEMCFPCDYSCFEVKLRKNGTEFKGVINNSLETFSLRELC